MYLGSLMQSATIQGNVRISLWRGDEEVVVEHIEGTENLINEPVRLLAWSEIKYIFAGTDGYLHIELQAEEKE